MTGTIEVSAKKMPLLTLSAMVVGSMVWAGVFFLPRNFGQATGGFGALLAWTIAGTGMLMLAFVFQTLAVRKPVYRNLAVVAGAGGDPTTYCRSVIMRR